MNSLDDVAAADDLAEGGEALTIRIALTAEVEGGLVADAEEEVGGGGVWAVAGHGDHALGVFYASNIRALERNRRKFRPKVEIREAIGLCLEVEDQLSK